jgi:hypothetical protein
MSGLFRFLVESEVRCDSRHGVDPSTIKPALRVEPAPLVTELVTELLCRAGQINFCGLLAAVSLIATFADSKHHR